MRRIFKAIEYGFIGAMVASFMTLIIAAAMLGFHFEWSEWHGRLVGVVATIVGACAATFGAYIALRTGVPKED